MFNTYKQMEYRYNNFTKKITIINREMIRVVKGVEAVRIYKEVSNFNSDSEWEKNKEKETLSLEKKQYL